MNNTPRTDLARPRSRLPRIAFALLASIFILLLALAWPLINEFLWPGSHNSALSAVVITATPSPFSPTGTPRPTATPTSAPAPTLASGAPFEAGGEDTFGGAIILGMREQGYARLFWHRLVGEPFTRLTDGAWDDIQPAVNPDGNRLAFASNRAGHWDIYTLDLTSGVTREFSDDIAYDGNPSWSTDGWLAYEHFDGRNLEIYMRPADASLEPVLISSHAAADYAPAWRPGAQHIAFISTRAGLPQLWLVDLEANGDARFQHLIPADAAQAAPAWSPDGSWLAWAQQEDIAWVIYAVDLSDPEATPTRLGPGTNPQWNPAGSAVLAELHDAGSSYLTAYTISGGLALAPELLPGNLDGSAWGSAALSELLPALLAAAAQSTPAATWDLSRAATGRETVPLIDVNAPFELLNVAALEPFDALRARAARLLGWDALSSLESAFVPINRPRPPARQQDWLYTGRAFELHSRLLGAGWMAVVREEYGGRTYWRVYLRAADQSGGLGRPLTELPWAFAAGGVAAAPAGYWVDFTALAADYGFERQPALANWRTYYQGALFNQFVLTAGLSWEEAMLQLYSPEEVATIQAASSP
ncbi:MAG: hypothetical protein WEA61_04865 [Anaerolineales bacterium]